MSDKLVALFLLISIGAIALSVDLVMLRQQLLVEWRTCPMHLDSS
jgi:hypothetical protein